MFPGDRHGWSAVLPGENLVTGLESVADFLSSLMYIYPALKTDSSWCRASLLFITPSSVGRDLPPRSHLLGWVLGWFYCAAVCQRAVLDAWAVQEASGAVGRSLNHCVPSCRSSALLQHLVFSLTVSFFVALILFPRF